MLSVLAQTTLADVLEISKMKEDGLDRDYNNSNSD